MKWILKRQRGRGRGWGWGLDVQSFVSPVNEASDFIKCRDLLNRLSGC